MLGFYCCFAIIQLITLVVGAAVHNSFKTNKTEYYRGLGIVLDGAELATVGCLIIGYELVPQSLVFTILFSLGAIALFSLDIVKCSRESKIRRKAKSDIKSNRLSL